MAVPLYHWLTRSWLGGCTLVLTMHDAIEVRVVGQINELPCNDYLVGTNYFTSFFFIKKKK